MRFVHDIAVALVVSTITAATAVWVQTPKSAPAPAPAVKASADIQAHILKLQLVEARIQAAFNACQGQDFQGQFNRTQVEIQEAINDAFKESKLDKKDWELSLDTFEFVKKQAAAPTTSPATPDKKP